MFFRHFTLFAISFCVGQLLHGQNFTVILGRPTDQSISANIVFDKIVDFKVFYGLQADALNQTIEMPQAKATIPNVVEFSGLQADTRYYYKLSYKLPSTGSFINSEIYTFNTQRALGKFTFTIEADEHLYDKKGYRPLYEICLANQAEDKPDDAAGKPLNHRGIFRFAVPQADALYRIDIEAGSERYQLLTRSLPDAIPQKLDGSFNLLLCSCYYQPEDKDGLLGTIVAQIKIQPHLIVMAGDQVYLDLPSFEDLPETDPEISRRLGKKYRRNWLSTALNIPGLEPVLARAPVVCIPDDHEFWNNYPFSQRQLPNTWNAEGRNLWAAAAKALYEDYQGCLDASGCCASTSSRVGRPVWAIRLAMVYVFPVPVAPRNV